MQTEQSMPPVAPLPLITVATWHQNIQSYSCQPLPPCQSASQMIKRQYASMSLVVRSSVHTSIYAAKQYTHDARNGISLSLGLRLVVWPCKSPSWSCRGILSAKRSHILTNSPLWMLCTSRYGMGSAACYKMRPNHGPGVNA